MSISTRTRLFREFLLIFFFFFFLKEEEAEEEEEEEEEEANKPPQPPSGHNLTIWATGTTSADIGAGAYVNVEIKYGYIRLLQKRLDICENAGQLNLTCPIKEGKFVLMKQVTLPGVIPPVSSPFLFFSFCLIIFHLGDLILGSP